MIGNRIHFHNFTSKVTKEIQNFFDLLEKRKIMHDQINYLKKKIIH